MTAHRGSFPLTRRLLLEGGTLVALAGVGPVLPVARATSAAADDRYPEAAFNQKDGNEAIRLLYDGQLAEPSDRIKLDAPEIAENGAVVPVSVTTTLADVTSIALVVPENPNPLAACYRLPPGTMPSVAGRLKMAKTSAIVAIVEAGGKLFSTSREVKVTVGGCGG